MKQFLRLFSLILMLITSHSIVLAQINDYTFSESTGNTFSSIASSGTPIALGDDADVQVNIGFTFNYVSTNYTQVNIGSNGYIAFGSNSAISYHNIIESTTSGYLEVMAVFWEDLTPSNPGGAMYYETQGSTPNRTFIVEYNNVPKYGSSSARLTAQVVLYESNSNIEFRYGTSTGTFPGGSIGLNESPGGSTHYISITPGSPSTTSTTTPNNSISTAPANGTNYIFSPPAYPRPTAQSEFNINTTLVSLNWTENGSATNWNIEYGATGFTKGSGTTVSTSSKPYSLTGLTMGATYDWYVQSDCGGGSTSSWAGPHSFTTSDGKAVNPTPADNATGIAITSKTLDWDDVGNATGYHISVGTTSGGSDIVNNAAISGGTNSTYTVSSNWLYNKTYYWTVTTNFSGGSTTGNEWSFTTTDGKAVNPTPADNTTGIAVTSKTLDWDDVVGATGYHISVGTTSGGTDIVNNQSTASSTYTVSSNWSYSTVYYWTVTTDYSGGAITGDEWQFSSECGTYLPPYSQDFTSYLPMCWTEKKGQLQTTVSFYSSSSYWYKFGFANYGTTGSAGVGISYTHSYQWLISPSIDLSGGNYEADFDIALTPDNGTGSASLEADDSVVVVISTDNGTTWSKTNALKIWKYGDAISNGSGDHITIDLSSYHTTVKLGFYATSTINNTQNLDFYLDNFVVQTPPACTAPTNLTEANIGQTSVDLGWTENGSATTWEIEYGAKGFKHGSGTTISVTTNPYTLTGLNSSTDYRWYVRADCGSGSKSYWGGAHDFTTTAYTATTNGKTTECSPGYTREGESSGWYYYDKYSFTVATSGNYNITANWTKGSGNNYDGYLYLYQTSFDPDNPSTNLLASNDDYTSTSKSKIKNQALTAGTTYIVVGSDYNEDCYIGNMEFIIKGPSVITANANTDYNGTPDGYVHNPPTTDGSIRTATYECNDKNGITHYYYDNGTVGTSGDDVLLLSIKKNSENIGSVGDGTFSLTLAGTAGVSHITNPPADYVSSWGGWYVFNRYWKLTPTSQPSSGVNVIYYYTTADYTALQNVITNDGGTAPSNHTDMYTFKINDVTGSYDPNPANGHSGVPLAASNGADGCWIYSNGASASQSEWKYTNLGSDFHSMETVVTHFSGGGGGSGNTGDDGSGTPLPVELLSLTGNAYPTYNLIRWTTASEINTHEFVIQRSANTNEEITEVGRVEAAGNSNTVLSYDLRDESPLETGYYRLVSVDIDGATKTSAWIFIQRKAKSTRLMNIYPNPVTNMAFLAILSNERSNAILQVRDITGRLLILKNLTLESGTQNQELDVSSLKSGTYQLTLIINGIRINKTMIKQ